MSVGTTLGVTGATTLSGTLGLPGITSVFNDSVLMYNSTTKQVNYFSNSAFFSGWTYNTGTIYPTQTTTVVAIGKNTVASGYVFNILGNERIEGDAIITGNSTIAGTLGVTSLLTTFAGITNTGLVSTTTLTVSGATTLNGAVTVNNTVNISAGNSLTVGGNATIGGSTVGGTTFVLQNLPNTSQSNILYYNSSTGGVTYGTSPSSSYWSVTGSLLYPNLTTYNVAIGKTTTAGGFALDVSGNANISTALTVGGNATISGSSISFPGIPNTTTSNILYYNSGTITYGAAPNTSLWTLDGTSTFLYPNTHSPTYNVVIGKSTTAGGIALDVSGNATISGSSISFPGIANTTTLNILYFNTTTGAVTYGTQSSASSYWSLSGTGTVVYPTTVTNSVAIGKSTVGTNIALDVSGNANVTGIVTSTSFNATSDYRIKKDVTPIPIQESTEIYKLNPVKYTNTISGKQDYGLLAHEVQEIFPTMVNGEKDQENGLQSINYTSLIPLLLKEIQDLKSQVKELQDKINCQN
jgi:hypothetical protein